MEAVGKGKEKKGSPSGKQPFLKQLRSVGLTDLS